MNKQESFLMLFGVLNFIWIHFAMYLSDELIDDIDWSSDLMVKKDIVQNSKIWNYLKHTTRWDSVFFIEISQNGYRYEKNHAFFPLFPLILNISTKILQYLIGYSYVEVLLLSNLIIQFGLYMFSIILMHRFSILQLNSQKYAFLSTILFCINPSAVHFNAIYTETIYTFTLLLSCYLFSKKFEQKKTFFSSNEFEGYLFSLSAIIAAFFACLIRSNGTLLIIHIGYPLFQRFLIDLGRYWNDRQKIIYLKNCIKEVLWAIFMVSTIFLSQLIVMKESIQIYCTKDNNVPWCQSLIPNAYPYLQVKHWNCGWFNGLHRVHYQLLIGIIPCIIVAFAIFYYFGINYKYIMTFGFKNNKQNTKKGFLNEKLTPLILYTLIFWNIYFFYAAIDSSNRFFSHNPVYYWFIAEVVINNERGKIQLIGCYIVLIIYFIYYSIGIFLFSNFIVWT